MTLSKFDKAKQLKKIQAKVARLCRQSRKLGFVGLADELDILEYKIEIKIDMLKQVKRRKK